ncbi:Y-family DNA polymerase [Alteromonas pelagimontana]|uniref:Y-family DNA polymerase n=1 Tax=Alteromonas pelagimontana TaxID=1858656 RepID=A0A6M4MGF0_9ALTE|nr:Y-family DNA polymerase [Alteromonas pelagimontana]QJR82153.1 Y-family DNA polymerase [Alteromonas pelagimontana]
MFALVDAVSMYASCEKVFDVSIHKRPVIVLSNNDGCVVAVCPIAKRLGFKKFVPFFQVANEAKKARVVVRSSNYALYADLSQRMMDTCARYAPESHVYSIDECFLRYDFTETDSAFWYDLGIQIRKRVWREVCLPVGVGFGPTPTLAKVANHAAKKIQGFDGVAIIATESEKKAVLNQMDVTDVWGIGRRLGARFNSMGITTALDLYKQTPSHMRNLFSINVENTIRELRGEIRFNWDTERPDKKEIYSTRSFGKRITDKQQLRSALVTHAEIVATKLRKRGCLAQSAVIFATNSPHDDAPYYRKSLLFPFSTPTKDTRQIISAVSDGIDALFMKGIKFYKCGVGLVDLVSENEHRQQDLFSSSADNASLMRCLDSINQRYGRNTLHFGARQKHQLFDMRRGFLSKCATTRWEDIPRILC